MEKEENQKNTFEDQEQNTEIETEKPQEDLSEENKQKDRRRRRVLARLWKMRQLAMLRRMYGN